MRAQQEVGFIWRAAGTWLNFDQLLGSTSPFSISGQWTLPPTGAEPDILATSFIFVLEREGGGAYLLLLCHYWSYYENHAYGPERIVAKN